MLIVIEIYSNALQILPPLVPSSQLVPKMDVGISAHSSGTQACNRDPVPEQDTLNRMVMDPDTALIEPVSNPDFIDLTLSD